MRAAAWCPSHVVLGTAEGGCSVVRFFPPLSQYSCLIYLGWSIYPLVTPLCLCMKGIPRFFESEGPV